jgi:hypothetical protein
MNDDIGVDAVFLTTNLREHPQQCSGNSGKAELVTLQSFLPPACA